MVVLALMAAAMTTRALAHKVNVFAWVEGDTVFVEGDFGGKRKAQNSLVEVFNKAGDKLLEGRTNKKGEFSFKPPEKTDLRIVLTDGRGHKNDFVVPAKDFGEVDSLPSGSPPAITQHKTDSPSFTMAPHQLEEMIDKTLDRKLDPVIKLIRESRREGPRLTEIIGGIGYIFGLVGVAVYFGNRKKGVRAKQNKDH